MIWRTRRLFVGLLVVGFALSLNLWSSHSLLARTEDGSTVEREYWIQVAAYRQNDRARPLRNRLEDLGYTVRTTRESRDGTVFFQVQVGRYDTRSRAIQEARAMVRRGEIREYWIRTYRTDQPSEREKGPKQKGIQQQTSSQKPGTASVDDVSPPLRDTFQTRSERVQLASSDTEVQAVPGGRPEQLSPGYTDTDRPAGRYRRTADTLTLNQAYRRALRRNEQVQIAREDLRQARDDLTVARAQLLPDLNLEGETNRQKQNVVGGTAFGNESNTLGSLRFTQPIWSGGRLWSLRDAAEYRVNQQKNNYFRTRQQILLNVAQSYYGVEQARLNIEIAENLLRRTQKQLDQARARFDVRAISKTPVLRARVQVSQAREQLERARNQYDVALEQLALVLGMDEVPSGIARTPDVMFEELGMDTYVERALRNRRDYQQAIFSKREATERLDIEQADWYPSLDFEAEGTRYDKPVVGQREDWSVAAVVRYPLFNGWQDQAEIEQARSRLRQADQQLQRLKREIRLDVRESYLNVQTQQKVIQALLDQVDSARQNYLQVSAQFREGLANSVDVSDAITVLNESERRLSIARTQYQLDVLRLRLATGVFQESLLERTSK